MVADTPPVPPRPLHFKGRGANDNSRWRFEQCEREAIDDGWGRLDEDPPPLRTEVGIDTSRTVISYNQSPDIPFDRTINPYRGCEHGCIYCYARPSHAYLGLSPGLDFESRLLMKPNAAALLRQELAKPGYRCAPIALGMNTDAYQPIERRNRITRSIIEVLALHRHPFTLVTKSAMVERDLDLIAPMAALGLASIHVSITTLDRSLARRLEPRAAAPDRRLEVLRRLTEAGIPCGVMIAPVIPALTDHELEQILQTAHACGARRAGYVLLRLPHEVAGLFEAWLQQHYPLKAAHVMSLIRQSRGGKTYDADFSTRMRGEGLFAEMISKRYRLACRRLGMNQDRNVLDCAQFEPPARPSNTPQMTLF